MSAPVNLIAIIYPREGKVDRMVELLANLSVYVKANEPDTLKYELNREVNKKTGVEELIMLETYTSMAALGPHANSPQFLAFQKTIKDEDLVSGPMVLKFIKPVAGFAARI